MRNLWNSKEAKLFSKSKLQHRVYSSRLLGRNHELVLHGGGNTSVKGQYKTIFGDKIETLYIKGSGWNLISIEDIDATTPAFDVTPAELIHGIITEKGVARYPYKESLKEQRNPD